MKPTFHIHVDAKHMGKPLLETLLEQVGFEETNFSGHPEGFNHFEPNEHLTLKVYDYKEFLRLWDKTVELVDADSTFVGYLEGECIKTDRDIDENSYKQMAVPFTIERRRLDGSQSEQFRQSELHLTMDKDTSEPELIQNLLKAGLYGAYIPKKDHTALVLTAQGYEKDIKKLTALLWDYIQQVGGVKKGTLKEEVAIAHKMYGVSSLDLPEIINLWEIEGEKI